MKRFLLRRLSRKKWTKISVVFLKVPSKHRKNGSLSCSTIVYPLKRLITAYCRLLRRLPPVFFFEPLAPALLVVWGIVDVEVKSPVLDPGRVTPPVPGLPIVRVGSNPADPPTAPAVVTDPIFPFRPVVPTIPPLALLIPAPPAEAPVFPPAPAATPEVNVPDIADVVPGVPAGLVPVDPLVPTVPAVDPPIDPLDPVVPAGVAAVVPVDPVLLCEVIKGPTSVSGQLGHEQAWHCIVHPAGTVKPPSSRSL